MALDNAALLEVLEAMQAAGVEERVRTAAQTIYQALIDAELTAVIGAGPWERTADRSAQRNGNEPGAEDAQRQRDQHEDNAGEPENGARNQFHRLGHQ